MAHRPISFRPLGAALKGILAVGPILMLLTSALHLRETVGLIVLVLSAGALVGVVFGLGVRISETRTYFVVSLLPFWRSRIRKTEVASVGVEEVRPFEDFGGWGIKGRSRRKGLLYSAGGSTVVALTTIDGRRYLASVRADDASRIAAAIQDAAGVVHPS